MALGIGVITYRRPGALVRTLQKIENHTKVEYCLVVANDEAPDRDLTRLCNEHAVPLISGANRGVCWNKNRALYALMTRTRADPILLLEDDCYPVCDTWAAEWVRAAGIYSHVNFAHPAWPAGWCAGGTGKPTDPWLTKEITGQATITTRAAVHSVGYLDTRFKGYGYGHIEWTERFCKAGYFPRASVPCITCGLVTEPAESHRGRVDLIRNCLLHKELRPRPFDYRPPWSTPEEEKLLKEEVASSAPPAVRTANV